MRTAVSEAPSLRHLDWQAAFTTMAYQTSSPVFWQHVFVSDTPMTNWSGGSSLFLNWAAEKRAPWKAKALHPQKGPPDSSRRDGISPHFHLLSPSPPTRGREVFLPGGRPPVNVSRRGGRSPNGPTLGL